MQIKRKLNDILNMASKIYEFIANYLRSTANVWWMTQSVVPMNIFWCRLFQISCTVQKLTIWTSDREWSNFHTICTNTRLSSCRYHFTIELPHRVRPHFYEDEDYFQLRKGWGQNHFVDQKLLLDEFVENDCFEIRFSVRSPHLIEKYDCLRKYADKLERYNSALRECDCNICKVFDVLIWTTCILSGNVPLIASTRFVAFETSPRLATVTVACTRILFVTTLVELGDFRCSPEVTAMSKAFSRVYFWSSWKEFPMCMLIQTPWTYSLF